MSLAEFYDFQKTWAEETGVKVILIWRYNLYCTRTSGQYIPHFKQTLKNKVISFVVVDLELFQTCPLLM